MTNTFCYKTEFPNFVLDIVIPDGFDDQSDASAGECPQWEDSYRNLVLVIDYANPMLSADKRPYSEDRCRFSIMEDDRCGGGVGFTSNNYNDILEILAKEARAFSSFSDSKEFIKDLTQLNGYDFDEPSAGYVYLKSFWIEDKGDAGYYVLIGRGEYESRNLDDLERLLWNLHVRSEVFKWSLPSDYLTDDVIAGLNNAADLILSKFGTINDRSYDKKAVELREQNKSEAAEIMVHLSAIWDILGNAN